MSKKKIVSLEVFDWTHAVTLMLVRVHCQKRNLKRLKRLFFQEKKVLFSVLPEK